MSLIGKFGEAYGLGADLLRTELILDRNLHPIGNQEECKKRYDLEREKLIMFNKKDKLRGLEKFAFYTGRFIYDCVIFIKGLKN